MIAEKDPAHELPHAPSLYLLASPRVLACRAARVLRAAERD